MRTPMVPGAFGFGNKIIIAGIKKSSTTKKLQIPRMAKMANSWIAVMRLTSRDPRPITVVKMARTVGNVILAYAFCTA